MQTWIDYNIFVFQLRLTLLCKEGGLEGMWKKNYELMKFVLLIKDE